MLTAIVVTGHGDGGKYDDEETEYESLDGSNEHFQHVEGEGYEGYELDQREGEEEDDGYQDFAGKDVPEETEAVANDPR